tara:strand:+ start:15217 stop:16236 length:1020 start_codon:yes stop_codon:yes gene_type:complete
MDYYKRVRKLLGDEEDEDYGVRRDFERGIRREEKKDLRDSRLEQNLSNILDYTMRAGAPAHAKKLPPMPDMMEGSIRDLKESAAERQGLRSEEFERSKLLDSLDEKKSARDFERQYKTDTLNFQKSKLKSDRQAATELSREKHLKEFLKSDGYKLAQKGIKAADAVKAQLKIGSDHVAAGNTQQAVTHMKSILKMINQMLVNSPDAVSEGEIKLLAPELEIASFQKLLGAGEEGKIIGADPEAFIKKLKLMSNASARRHHQNQIDSYTDHMQGFNPETALESISKLTQEYGDLMPTKAEKRAKEEDSKPGQGPQPVIGARNNIGPTEYVYTEDGWVPVK